MYRGKQFTNSDSILEDISIGVLILNTLEGKIVFQNKHFRDLLGIHTEYVIENILDFIKSEKSFKIHNDINIDDKLSFGYSIYPVKGKKDLTMILISNISSKKIYLDSKSQKNYYKKLSKYSSEIAHEVGNPLTSVIMTLQVLSKNLKTWDFNQQEEYIDTTIKELKRLSNFMNRVRDLSKNMDLDIKKHSLKEIITRAIIQNTARLDSNKITINDNLPDDICICVDEDALYQIIFNLIQNSLDILPSGSKIDLNIEEIDDFFVTFTFSNNGPHIPDSIKKKIFLPFFSTKEGGSGIGLDLSLKLMTNMGGTIKVENLKKKGVKFTLFIPVADENRGCEK